MSSASNDTAGSGLFFRQLFDRETCTYTYILGDSDSREAVLIDPVDTLVERDLQFVREFGLQLKFCLNTHIHADHITGSGLIKEQMPGVKSVLGAGARPAGAIADRFLEDGEKLSFGQRSLTAISTPGHTDGCTSYLLDDRSKVFTGDTLFIRGCGRTDFQQGSSSALYESVHTKLYKLPDTCEVFPGHDYKGRTVSTIGEEKKFNPRLTKTQEEFVQLMADLKLADPKKIDVAVPRNLSCGYLVEDPRTILPPISIAARLRLPNSVILDVRRDEEREQTPLLCKTDSLSIESQAVAAEAISTAHAGGKLPSKNTPIIVFCRSGGRAGVACEKFQQLGYICVANAGSRDTMQAACDMVPDRCKSE